MNLVRRSQDRFEFHLGKREQQVLLCTLKMYPLVPPAHHRITSEEVKPDAEQQRLLDEALAEQRQANRNQVLTLLAEPHCRPAANHGWDLTLSLAQMECLLQVLNDIRVGSWLILGEPDGEKEPRITPKNMRYMAALEICGLFQSVLLQALGVEQSPEWH